ncbi:hypothetical protein [Natronorubrum halalkaliphilum]|uniref:hypothetical protein n=1 Tax=Natronorubrum halalkaliphilum TaxID=2691917 RepID=UPI00191670A8|nr:hypothetical protein [Natronorubrum halalkaliphilum]
MKTDAPSGQHRTASELRGTDVWLEERVRYLQSDARCATGTGDGRVTGDREYRRYRNCRPWTVVVFG